MIRNRMIWSVFIVLAMGTLFSCENSIQTVQKITAEDTLAEATAMNIQYVRTDSGRLQLILKSPVLVKYGGSQPHTEFPKGFYIQFYNRSGKLISTLSAHYGVRWDKRYRLEARNQVVVKNLETGEQLDTENLSWDENKGKIYTHSFVKITSPDRTIFGDSLTANETFSQRTVYGIRGVMDIQEDTIP